MNMLLLCSIMWFKITVLSSPTSHWSYKQEICFFQWHTHKDIYRCAHAYVCVYNIVGLNQSLNKRNYLKILFPQEIKHSQG